MRINTNIPSLQSVHRLSANQADLGIRLERLSTGLRINNGKDDPAGLIASEMLRSEIGGITQAIDNSQRAINVLTTAEGALNEVSSLLLDMRALINHAANEGANSIDEIRADQLQLDSVLEAIDRIASTTTFAGEQLINGSKGYTTSGIAGSAIANVTVYGARFGSSPTTQVDIDVLTSAQTAQVVFSGNAGILSASVTIELQVNRGSEVLVLTSGLSASQIASVINANSLSTGVSATASGAGATAHVSFNSVDYGADAFVSVRPLDAAIFGAAKGIETKDFGQNPDVLIDGQQASTNGFTAVLRTSSVDIEIELTQDRATMLGSSNFHLTGGGALFQIGPRVTPNGQISIGIPNMGTAHLGDAATGFLYTLKGGAANSMFSGNFAEAERILDKAVEQVAVVRGRLGALQRNQIETNISSQRIAMENVMAAESSIRDADIAVEVAALTRSQILVQSTTQVLGMANQMPNNVLSLLG